MLCSHRSDLIVSEISGSYTNVVGLPVEKLKEELKLWKRKFRRESGVFFFTQGKVSS